MQEPKDEGDSEELARFRQQWLEEVRRNKKARPSQSDAVPSPPVAAAPASGSASTPANPTAEPQLVHQSSPASHRNVVHGAVVRKSGPSSASATAQFGPALQRAVEVYRKAVQHEQLSELDEALRLYRTAFRLDSNVDRAYYLLEDELQRNLKAAAVASTPVQRVHHQKTPSGKAILDGLVHDLQGLELGHGSSHVPVARVGRSGEGFVTGVLAKLISAWPKELLFNAEDEKESVPLETLPDELLLHVLRLLDHASLERFARVNRKARLITLDASIWRPMVKTIYQPPQIADEEELESLVVKYMTDYRRVYIEHPRVRYDGVYIAVCHYIRNGIGESVWVNYSHLITYYRYLRFYPDGQVLSLLANEELAPSQIIPLLKPSLRMKGFLIGTWFLDGTEIHIDDLMPMEPGAMETRYSFQMVLDLRSRPVGRWNRLDFRAYDSVHAGSGEAVPLALKNERPFWFSRVRSYV